MTHPVVRRTRAPWSFRLATFLIRHHLRGGYRLMDFAERRGWLNCLVRYQLTPEVSLDVPLFREENQWSEDDVRGYEQALVRCLVDRLRDRPGPIRLVDCGADIGIMPALLASQLPKLSEVWACEPNPAAYDVLEGNVRLLPCTGHALRAAVSDFSGRGALTNSATDPSDHARFLVPAPNGDVDVLRLDDRELGHDGTLAVKIDVEGGEMNVLRGAANTLSSRSHWVVAFEAHRDVCARTGIDPCEILRWLQSLRGVSHVVAERPEVVLDPSRPFFEQITSPRIVNVVCWTEK